jgi:hypothetical protein
MSYRRKNLKLAIHRFDLPIAAETGKLLAARAAGKIERQLRGSVPGTIEPANAASPI